MFLQSRVYSKTTHITIKKAMKTIISRQNVEIKAVDKLKNAKDRTEQGRFLAEGLRTIETLMTKYKPIQVYATETYYATHAMPISKDRLTLVPDAVMQKISTTNSPAGILAVFALPENPTKPLSSGVVLARITNPGNMGTLIRTAAAMGKKSVVVVEGTDIWSPKVIQATAGALALVDIYELSWQELLALKGSTPLCALVVKGGTVPEQLKLQQALIVVGNEAEGLPDEWADACELKCTLNMPGNTESLNAAVAGSIVLYLARGA